MNSLKFVFLLGIVICLPLYGFLCVTALDPVTASFTVSNNLTLALYGAWIAVPLLLMLVAAIRKKRLSFSISNSKILGVFALGVGILMLASSFPHVMTLKAMYDNGVVPISSMIMAVAQVPVSVISSFVFIKLGISYFRENITNRGSASFVFPLIWALITCVEMFREYPQIAGMPERMLYLLFLLSFTLFQIGHSRILGYADVQKGIRWSACFGYTAALFGFCLTVGEGAAFRIMSLPLFDFALAFVLSCYCLFFAINTSIEKK